MASLVCGRASYGAGHGAGGADEGSAPAGRAQSTKIFLCNFNVGQDGGQKNCHWWNGRCCNLYTSQEYNIKCPKLNSSKQEDLQRDINQYCQYQQGGCAPGQTASCETQADISCRQTMICGRGNNFIYDRSYLNHFKGRAYCTCK